MKPRKASIAKRAFLISFSLYVSYCPPLQEIRDDVQAAVVFSIRWQWDPNCRFSVATASKRVAEPHLITSGCSVGCRDIQLLSLVGSTRLSSMRLGNWGQEAQCAPGEVEGVEGTAGVANFLALEGCLRPQEGALLCLQKERRERDRVHIGYELDTFSIVFGLTPTIPHHLLQPAIQSNNIATEQAHMSFWPQPTMQGIHGGCLASELLQMTT